jgi:hypothetical protein
MSAPTTFSQEARSVELTAMAAAAYVKLSEQKAKLFGLFAPKPAEVTNNLHVGFQIPQSELKRLEASRTRELEDTDARNYSIDLEYDPDAPVNIKPCQPDDFSVESEEHSLLMRQRSRLNRQTYQRSHRKA